MDKVRSLKKGRVSISLACIIVAMLAPYFSGILWMHTMPGIFQSDALSRPMAVLWGTGLLALSLMGIVICLFTILMIIATKGAKKWMGWVNPN